MSNIYEYVVLVNTKTLSAGINLVFEYTSFRFMDAICSPAIQRLGKWKIKRGQLRVIKCMQVNRVKIGKHTSIYIENIVCHKIIFYIKENSIKNTPRT